MVEEGKERGRQLVQSVASRQIQSILLLGTEQTFRWPLDKWIQMIFKRMRVLIKSSTGGS